MSSFLCCHPRSGDARVGLPANPPCTTGWLGGPVTAGRGSGVYFVGDTAAVRVRVLSLTAAVTCVPGVWLSDREGQSLSLWGSELPTTRCIHALEVTSLTRSHLDA